MAPTLPRQPAMQASARKAAAAAWLSGAKWKMIAMRGTRSVPASVSEEALPAASRITMRVFAEGCPGGCLREVLELLTAEYEVRDPLVDGTVQPGLWKHRLAVWNRDNDATKTLIRDFYDGAVSFGSAVESGCTSETTVRYVFDAVEPEALPPAEQGTVVRIGGLSRDRETGLFTYYVTETVRKTRSQGFRKISETAFETVYEARWDGVYTTPTDDITGPKTHEGIAITDIPAAASSTGTAVSVQWDQDPQDCTWTAVARKTEAKEKVDRGRSCEKDVFKEDHSTALSGVNTATDPTLVPAHAPAPSEAAGTVSSVSVQIRPDGLADVTAGLRTEAYVQEAAQRAREDKYHKSSSYTDKADRAANAAFKLAQAGVSAGKVTTVDISKTPSGRADVTVTVDEELNVPRARVAVSRDVYRKSTAVTARSSTAAEPALPGSVTQGTLVKVSAEITPGDRRDVSTETDESIEVTDAASEGETNFFGSSARTVGRFLRAIPAAIGFSAGRVRSRTVNRNPDATYDVTETLEESIPREAAATESSETVFGATTRTVARFMRSVQASVPRAVGEVRSRSVSVNRDGTSDVTDSLETSVATPEAEVTYSQTVYSRAMRAVTRFARARVAGFKAVALGKVYRQSSSIERDGSFMNSEEVTEALPVANASKSQSADLFFGDESAEDRSVGVAGVLPATGSGGVTASVRSTVNPDATFDVARGVRTERPVSEASIRYTVLPWLTMETVTDRHVSAPHPVDPAQPGSVEYSRTPGGLYDRTRTRLVAGSARDGFVLRHTKGGDRFKDVEDTDTIQSSESWTGLTPGLTGAGIEGGAKITEITFAAQQDGTFIRSVRETSVRSAFVFTVSKSYFKTNTQTSGKDSVSLKVWSFVNASEARVQSFIDTVSGAGLFSGVSFSHGISINEFGLYNGTVSVRSSTKSV